jgi:hypothetical protein
MRDRNAGLTLSFRRMDLGSPQHLDCILPTARHPDYVTILRGALGNGTVRRKRRHPGRRLLSVPLPAR